jgi:hypothetical protein
VARLATLSQGARQITGPLTEGPGPTSRPGSLPAPRVACRCPPAGFDRQHYLGRPGSIWDEAKPWRTLAVRVIHLGYQRGGSGLGSLIPTARAARGHWVKGEAHAEGGEETRTSAACSLPLRGTATAIGGRGSRASGEVAVAQKLGRWRRLQSEGGAVA